MTPPLPGIVARAAPPPMSRAARPVATPTRRGLRARRCTSAFMSGLLFCVCADVESVGEAAYHPLTRCGGWGREARGVPGIGAVAGRRRRAGRLAARRAADAAAVVFVAFGRRGGLPRSIDRRVVGGAAAGVGGERGAGAGAPVARATGGRA